MLLTFPGYNENWLRLVGQSTLWTLTRESEPEPPVSLRTGQRATETERARGRYAMARKYAGINVKTQEAAITHRHTFQARKLPAVLCFFRSVLSTWSLYSFKNDTC